MRHELHEFDTTDTPLTRRRLLGTMALTTLIALELAMHESEIATRQIGEIAAEVSAISSEVALLADADNALEPAPHSHEDDMVDAARWIPTEQ